MERPSLTLTDSLREGPDEVAAFVEGPHSFEHLLPTLVARFEVAYPVDRLAVGTRVTFHPRVFPRRWTIESELVRMERNATSGARDDVHVYVWAWRRGPLKGTETWLLVPRHGGTRIVREFRFTGRKLRERLFWWTFGLVGVIYSSWAAGVKMRRRLRRRGAAGAG